MSTIRPIYNNYVYKLSQRNDASTTDTEDLYRTNQLLRELVDNTAYQYTYDALGNITAITKGVRTNTDTDDTAAGGFAAYRSYGYDSLGQLTRENNATNNKTNVFVYDELGNITSKTEYDYTTGDLGSINKTILYGYSNDGKQGWNNLLTSVDLNGDGVVGNGETITYDEIGNPTTYLGNTLAWDGRRLTNYNNIAYSYDADGIRASKTIGTARTEYFYVGDKLVYQAVKNTATGDVTYEMYFFYDSYNHLTAIRYVAGATDHYYYVTTNMQGDVLGIYTAAGVLLASYEYDAWGNCTVTTHNANYTIGDLNPIRYRGYYYDTETGFYYCNSRYYDPEIGRWINADGVIAGVGGDVKGYNLFAYCMNNPVNMSDPSGGWPSWNDIKVGFKKVVNWVDNNIIQPVVGFVKDIAEDINNFDLNNESEEKVLESNYFSSYKGVPVIRTNGDRSGSFGAIFLTRETNNRSNPEDVIRHEYGHTKQLEQLGIVNYALCIGLPSWQQWGTGEYYSKPWEITADVYGGVQSRNHSQSNIDRGFAYLEGSKIIGPLIWVFIE